MENFIRINDSIQTEDPSKNEIYINSKDGNFVIKMLSEGTHYRKDRNDFVNPSVVNQLNNPSFNVVTAGNFNPSSTQNSNNNVTGSNLSNTWYLVPQIATGPGYSIVMPSVSRPTPTTSNYTLNTNQFIGNGMVQQPLQNSSSSNFERPNTFIQKVNRNVIMPPTRKLPVEKSFKSGHLNDAANAIELNQLRERCTGYTSKIKMLNQKIRRQNEKIIKLEEIVKKLKSQV